MVDDGGASGPPPFQTGSITPPPPPAPPQLLGFNHQTGPFACSVVGYLLALSAAFGAFRQT